MISLQGTAIVCLNGHSPLQGRALRYALSLPSLLKGENKVSIARPTSLCEEFPLEGNGKGWIPSPQSLPFVSPFHSSLSEGRKDGQQFKSKCLCWFCSREYYISSHLYLTQAKMNCSEVKELLKLRKQSSFFIKDIIVPKIILNIFVRGKIEKQSRS